MLRPWIRLIAAIGIAAILGRIHHEDYGPPIILVIMILVLARVTRVRW